jgi:endonuclease YncB( thermonuclease family)
MKNSLKTATLIINAILLIIIAGRINKPVFKQLANSDLVVEKGPTASQESVMGESTDGTQDNVFVVERVIDGDTIELSNGKKVRYIGIDTPEMTSKNSQCYAQKAKEKNEELVLGKKVTLEKDVSETDKYGRLLRYVYINDLFVNEYMVAEGYAKVTTYPPDVAYKDVFLNAERSAREQQKGLWSECL